MEPGVLLCTGIITLRAYKPNEEKAKEERENVSFFVLAMACVVFFSLLRGHQHIDIREDASDALFFASLVVVLRMALMARFPLQTGGMLL